MKDSIILEGKIYISAKRAAKLISYAQDYIGQLCRVGKLDCKMVGRSWFVTEASLFAHRENAIDNTQERILKSKTTDQGVKEISPDTSAVTSTVQAGKITSTSVESLATTPAAEIASALLSKNAPVVSPIQYTSFKYEAENKPLLPELKKKVPSPFALQKNTNNVFAFTSAPFVKTGRKVLVRSASITPTNLSSLITRNSSHVLPTQTFSSAFASTISPAAISRAHQLTTLAVTLLAVGGFFFTLSIATFQNTSRMTYSSSSPNQASVSSATSELLGELMKAIGLKGRSPVAVRTQEPAPVVTTAGDLNGIGIFPATNSTEDEIMKARIMNSFSDEVTVRPDQSGTAGVITPVFKQVNGTDFVYVMVPVNEKVTNNSSNSPNNQSQELKVSPKR